jgi:hypothetical protein
MSRQIITLTLRHAPTSARMPRIGCGRAGGNWDQIEPLLHEHLAIAGFDVCVYDLPTT